MREGDAEAKAVEEYRRQRVLEQANEAYAALRADPKAWLENTLADGLDD
ncbi:MAG: hypothetical protein HY681_02660 [Chloroflexi bacterium]|nr:hypothetical protein [Chloroflexota bacterium]